MRYSTEAKYRKYVKEYRFLSFVRKFGDKYGRKLMDTVKKNRNRCYKNCFQNISSKKLQKLQAI